MSTTSSDSDPAAPYTPSASTASSSYVLPSPSSTARERRGGGLLGTPSESGDGAPSDSEDAVDSLPSTSVADSEFEDEDEDGAAGGRGLSDAEREWRESLQQLELLLTMVVVPYLGKYFGRKCAYWGEFARFSLFPLGI